MNNKFYVYEHWRPDTNACFYVGKGQGSRARDMRGRNRYHLRIQRKLRTIGASIEVKIIARDMEESDAYSYEAQRIAFWRGEGVRLTNQAISGPSSRSGWHHTEEFKNHLSALTAGRHMTEEQRRRYLGPKSAEHIAAMRVAASGRKRPPPRTADHLMRQTAGIRAMHARHLSDPAYIAKREQRRTVATATKAAERLSIEHHKAIEADEIAFILLMRSIANGTSKYCTMCRELKAPEQFGRSTQFARGRRSECNKCWAERIRLLRQTKREVELER